MEIRGRRECTECGTVWSYYETGSIECPDCGSLRSTGIDDERTLHTDAPAEIDLTSIRGLVADEPLEAVTDATLERTREYVRNRGFVHAGELRELDDAYLAVRELTTVADAVGRSLDPTDDEEWYFLELLRVADRGERPDPDDVPSSLRGARGLAYANAVEEYRSEALRWIERTDDPPGPEFARKVLGSIADHVKRTQALQGDVPPRDAEALVAATRDVGAYLRSEDPDGLASARERLDRLVEE